MQGKVTKIQTYLPYIALLLSVVCPFLVINTSGFPYLGLSFTFISFALLLFFMKEKRSNFQHVLFILLILLSYFFVARVNIFLTFLNFILLSYLFFLILLPEIKSNHFIIYLILPVVAFFFSLVSKPAFSYLHYGKKQNKTKWVSVFSEHLPATILTIILLLITIPLLSYANPYFNELVNRVIMFLNLSWILQHFNLFILRFIAFLLILFFLPRMITVSQGDKYFDLPHTVSFTQSGMLQANFLIPKLTLAIVLVIFFITQIQLYFSTSHILLQMGYTHSQYAREVFTQLSIVAGIVFMLIYFDRSRKLIRHKLTYVLIIEAIFLSVIAFKSDLDYTMAWGFTHKRLYGFTVITWIIGTFTLFLYAYLKNHLQVFFIKRFIILTGIIVVLINLCNFDYLIYHYKKTSLPSGIDYFYLSNLSSDARMYKEMLQVLETDTKNSKTVDYNKLTPMYIVTNHLEYLQSKYRTFTQTGAFNLSEYGEYLQIKDLNVKQYREYINSKYNQQGTTNIPPQPAFR